MANKIIVLSGKQFSGKDTVAKMLLEYLPDFKRVGLGDAIKIEYGKQKNLTFDEIEKNKSQYRPDLISLGDWGRAMDADYWLKKIIETDGNIIVPDLRVPHELEIFRSHNAITIRVESPREKRAERGVLVKEDDPTETLLDSVLNWDYIVINDAGLEELTTKVQNLAQEIKTKL